MARLGILFGIVGLGAGLACRSPRPAVPAPSSSTHEAPSSLEGECVGILRQVGNAPHIELVITGESALGRGDHYIVGPLAKEMAGFPLGRIRVKGRLRRLELKLAGSSGRIRTRFEIEVTTLSP